LRQNGGGYLDEAVKTADLFLPKSKLVVFTAGRAFKDTTKYETKNTAMLKEDFPLIILVDGHSASASEIVSGAVQDWDRGLIIGRPTVGKGSVQQTVPIGDKAELKLTMAAYFLPSGRSIDKRMRKDSTLVALADKEFHTRTLGRIAHGAGGVTPDIHMDRRRRSPLYSQLDGWRTWDSKFFRYTRQYHVDHPEITEDFIAEKSTLRDFKEFAEEQEFEYVSEVEKRLEGLSEHLEEEEALDDLKKPMRRFREEIEEIEEKHWAENEELLQWRLTYDIIEKNLGIWYAHRYDVTTDPQIQRAVEILSDPVEYQSYLNRPEIGVDPDNESVAATADSMTSQ
jgi:carboxyl-terminal processing protease